MALHNAKVELQPVFSPDPSLQDSVEVQRAWGELLYRSVEAMSASLAGFEDFAGECVYAATIRAKSQLESHGSCVKLYNLWENTGDVRAEETDDPGTIVGLVYLKTSSLPGTFDIGAAIIPEERGKGWGPEAITLVMKWAFEELHCHRLQARIVESNARWRDVATRVLMRLGFSLEGTARRALFCPTHPLDPYPEGMNGEWRDVFHFAILDVDWVMFSGNPDAHLNPIKLRWKEQFAREERERAELLRFEEYEEKRVRTTKRRRTTSMETLTDPFTLPNSSSFTFTPTPVYEYPFSVDAQLQTPDKGKGVWRSSETDTLLQSAEATFTQRRSSSIARSIQGSELGWTSSYEDRGSSIPSAGWSSPPLLDQGAASMRSQHSVSDFESEDEMLGSSMPLAALLAPRVAESVASEDSVSEVGSVPRSASVVSDTSTRGLLDAEDWDFLETASVGSSAVQSASDDEV